jgi:ComF family protein
MLPQKSLARVIFRDFISLFYPDYCLGCSNSLVSGERLICTRCILQMPQTSYHLNQENPLKSRLSGRLPVLYALAFFKFSKSGRIQQVLHALKYKNHPDVGVLLGKVYGQRLKETGCRFDLIVPVPLHPSRLRKRGYNQSGKFAEGLSEGLGIPYSEKVLGRTVKTVTQTNKTKLKRWENVSEVFRIMDGQLITRKHILLVDDVITTGATIEACGKVLTENGCCSISIASIAVA